MLVEKIFGNDIWGRPLLLLGIILIVIGIQFFSVGIVADLLMRTYYESQKKRPYSIRKIVTASEQKDLKSTTEAIR